MALWRQMVTRAKWIKLAVLRPRQNGCHFADNIFKCIFLDGNVWISIKISLTFVLKDPINNIPALVQIIAWRRPGDKPLSEPMMVILLTHICVIRPLCVKLLPLLPWMITLSVECIAHGLQWSWQISFIRCHFKILFIEWIFPEYPIQHSYCVDLSPRVSGFLWYTRILIKVTWYSTCCFV